MNTVRIKKWGNSLALRIPKHMADDMKLTEDSTVEIRNEAGNLVVIPVKNVYSLDELVAQITRENRHDEIGPNDVIGNEIW